jgi:WD40 repeat protein
VWSRDGPADGPGPGTPGPVAFRADGRAVQLAADDTRTFRLAFLDTGETARTFRLPAGGDAGPITRLKAPALFVGPGAGVVAASADAPGGGVAAVWDADDGRLLHVIQTRATAITVSDDNSLVAAGDSDGVVRVWGLPFGGEVARFELGGCEVHALEFGPDPRRRGGPGVGPPSGWLLAGGDSGGNVVVWDLHDRQVKTRCTGSLWEVYAVRFHPDGQTLITGGRNTIRFWDVATGRKLLYLPASAFLTGLAVSPDGGKVAVTGVGFGGHTALAVWRLEFGRGIREWRGLTAPVTQTALSPDGRYLAGLSANWQVAVWDRTAGRLVHLLDATRGFTADNAALRFDAAGRRFAFASGRGAKLWDVQTGRVLGAWAVPPGLQDHLAFRGDRLFLARMEVTAGEPGPFAEAPPATHPRVCPVRELVAPGTVRGQWAVTDHPLGCRVTGDVDGAFVVTDSQGGNRTLTARDLETGRVAWSRPTVALEGGGEYDSTVENGAVAFRTDEARMAIVDLRTGEPRSVPGPPPRYLHLNHDQTMWTGVGNGGAVFGRTSDGSVLFSPTADRPGHAARIARVGERDLLIWGTMDGAALIAELPEVRRRLRAVGLDW